jgi:hypothetical protein
MEGKKKMNKFLITASLLLLSACAGVDQVDVHTVNDNPPALNVQLPSQIVTRSVQWTVLTQAQIQELAKQNNPNVVFFALDSDNFQNLSLNMAEIQRYLEQEKVVVLTYKKYYEGLQGTLTKK